MSVSNHPSFSAHHQRLARQLLYPRPAAQGGPSTSKSGERTTTELDVLKRHHRFIRSEDGASGEGKEGEGDEWGDRLAKKHYESLYKDWGIVDLKHWKTRAIAIRWRTESEVLSGKGETRCANVRCTTVQVSPSPTHSPSSTERRVAKEKEEEEDRREKLKEYEIPFSYVEGGQKKSTMVRVRVCARCARKLVPSRSRKEKGLKQDEREERGVPDDIVEEEGEDEYDRPEDEESKMNGREMEREGRKRRREEEREERHRRDRDKRRRVEEEERRHRPK
ncbi:hypothetical protein BT69DRAFT_1325823 [Atractiella rhizophila]|nr:hypothetical protein BT69DRAFT_1325823 [Atractiella rhizophila]